MRDEQNNAVMRFADGEMSGAEQAEIARRAAQEPQVARQVAHQQQLKAAVGRVMAEPGAAPADLRARIAAMTAQPDMPARPRTRRPAVIGFIGRWAPAAVAAVLLLAALLTVAVDPRDAATAGGETALLPAAQVDRLAKRHVTCSRSIEQLHGLTEFPQEVTALPTVLADRLGQATPGLDLSALGYRFDRIGKCIVPGTGSVHLVYTALPETGRTDALSLWIVADPGHVEIDPNRVYTVSNAADAHPTLIWRSGGLLYYLVGDAMDAVQRVANQLATAPAPPGHG